MTLPVIQAAMDRHQLWAEMNPEYFVALTLGELKSGDQFIFLPSPGDNAGNGGFKTLQYLFTKKSGLFRHSMNTDRDRDAAIRNVDQAEGFFPINTPVIRIQ